MNTIATTTAATAPEDIVAPSAFATYPPPGEVDLDLIDRLFAVLPVVADRPLDGSEGTALQQHTWRCRTGQCTAGWVRELTGVPWLVPVLPAGGIVGETDVLLDGDVVPVWRYARERLGLSREVAGLVFASHATLVQILAVLRAIREQAADVGYAPGYAELAQVALDADPWSYFRPDPAVPLMYVGA